MAYDPTPKEYKFSSVEDMLKFLNNDNVDLFLVDFGKMLKQAVAFRELGKLACELFDIEHKDDITSIESMTWIDDGKHESNTVVKFKEG